MCGLVGLFSYGQGFFKEEAEMFSSMILMNSIRGAHSTGLFAVDNKKQVDYLKVLGGPSHLFEHDMANSFHNRLVFQHRAVFGHGRLATRGAITIDNAHPFTVDQITLIHNGTLTNFEALKKRHNLEHIEVDSLLCAHLFARMSPEEVVKEIQGAWAFIWYDADTNSVYIMRNTERPLFMYDRPGKNMYMISSERSTFKYLEDKYALQGSLLSFKSDGCYHFPMGQKNFTFKEHPRPVTSYTPPTKQTQATHPQDYQKKIVPIANNNTGSSSRWQVNHIPGTSIRLDVWIAFCPLEEKTIGTDRFFTHGLTSGGDISHSVYHMHDNPLPDLKDGEAMFGLVDKIFAEYTKDKTRIDYKIHIKDFKIAKTAPVEIDLIAFGDGTTMPFKEANKLISKGCYTCSKPIQITRLQYVHVKDGHPLCLQCAYPSKIANESYH